MREHVKLVNPQNLQGLPQYRKWRLRDNGNALNQTMLRDIQPNQGHPTLKDMGDTWLMCRIVKRVTPLTVRLKLTIAATTILLPTMMKPLP